MVGKERRAGVSRRCNRRGDAEEEEAEEGRRRSLVPEAEEGEELVAAARVKHRVRCTRTERCAAPRPLAPGAGRTPACIRRAARTGRCWCAHRCPIASRWASELSYTLEVVPSIAPSRSLRFASCSRLTPSLTSPASRCTVDLKTVRKRRLNHSMPNTRCLFTFHVNKPVQRISLTCRMFRGSVSSTCRSS